MPRFSFNPLYVLWLLAVLALIWLQMRFSQPSAAFYGLVQSEKTLIRAHEAGIISLLNVSPGDSVSPGDTLLLLEQPGISRRQTEQELQLQRLSETRSVQEAELREEMRRAGTRHEAAMAAIEQDRLLWEARLAKDREAAALWRREAAPATDSLSILKRHEFELRKKNQEALYQSEIALLRQQLRGLAQPFPTDAARLQNELNYIEVVRGQQYVRAPHEGWVGDVMINARENALSGDPLIEIWGNRARYVEGYIHENFSATLRTGQPLRVFSVADPGRSCPATLVKLGNRIIEFPERLRRNPDVRLWGREAIVRLQEVNPFLIGEKVMIQTESEK